MKRLFDFVLAGIGLVLLSPLFLLAALMVRLDGPGPLLFRQLRVGLHGRPFIILKFRTMRPETQKASIALLTEENARRITRHGRLLRRSKLDELPQLLNVLVGQMSLVGPRPEVPHFVTRWSKDDCAQILSVRPGITDFASIMFRHEEQLLARQAAPEDYYCRKILPQKLRLCRFYARKASVRLDLWLIVQTIKVVLGLPSRPTLKA